MFKKIRTLFQRPETLQVNGQIFPILYKENARAKYLTMRLTTDHKNLSITVPYGATNLELQAFLERCVQWLASRNRLLARQAAQSVPFEHGVEMPVLGQRLTLLFEESRDAYEDIRVQETSLIIPSRRAYPRRIQAFLDQQLHSYVDQKSRDYADTLRAHLAHVRVKDLKSSYGLCSSNKTISYASRLVFAPLDVVDYICAHEVAHLHEMNHSPDFWKLVSHLIPTYKHHKAWLRAHGYTLSLYGKSKNVS